MSRRVTCAGVSGASSGCSGVSSASVLGLLVRGGGHLRGRGGGCSSANTCTGGGWDTGRAGEGSITDGGVPGVVAAGVTDDGEDEEGDPVAQHFKIIY